MFRPHWPLVLLGILGLVPAAAAQDYGRVPTTYHLHRGSTFQQGCWGPCACALSGREPMHGSFVLGLISVGDITDFYGLSEIHWNVPRLAGQAFGNVITGSGSFLAGQSPFADHQSMTLALSATIPLLGPPANAQTFVSDFGSRTVPPPIIRIDVANSDTGCPGTRLQLVATWFRSDWNADASISVQDVFDFLADYFSGRGDHNGDGATGVEDLFRFLADYFGGV